MNADVVLNLLGELKKIDSKKMCFQEIESLLNWDQDVYMPEAADQRRSEQLGLIAELGHNVSIDKRIDEILLELGSTTETPRGRIDVEIDESNRDYLRLMRRQYDSSTLLPSSFVSEYTSVCALAQSAWSKALKENNFSLFAGHLEKIVFYSRKKAEYLRPSVKGAKTAYDVLLDQYEPGITSEDLDVLFNSACERVSTLAKNIFKNNPQCPSFYGDSFDVSKQDDFCRRVMDKMGYDEKAGRLDLTIHPFTTTLGNRDVRITTRYEKNLMMSGFFSVVHEAGHALYEQNIDEELYNTSACAGVSMGIHESQSRMWENIFGRSRSFWKYWYGFLKEAFPAQLDSIPFNEWYKAVNFVKPSLIRVEADEVTYTLHVILRYRIEKALINGDLEVKDVPDAWARESEKLLGIRPVSDKEGCLQDVHWSCGLMGYFPSYALGNFYGAQFIHAMEKDGVHYDVCLKTFDTETLSAWLKEHIWKYGSLKFPGELLKMATGEKLCAQPFLDYLEKKYAEFL